MAIQADGDSVESPVYYCGVETRPVRYVDPEPAEHCETEVENEDDVCPAHDWEPDDDYDDYDHREELRERMAARYDMGDD